MDLEYVIKIVDKFSPAFEKFERMSKSATGVFGSLERRLQGFNEAVTLVGNVTQALDSMTEKTASLSDKMAIVQKNTGLSTSEMANLKTTIDSLNTRTATEALLDMASVGGKLGVPKQDLEGFVKVIDKATVALGDEFGGSAEAVAMVLGKIKGQYKEFSSIGFGDALQGIGSAINYLGKQGANSAPTVAEFTQRVSTLGLTLAQATGLGATLEELGLSAEIASGGLKAIYGLAGTNADKFAKVVGMTTKEFENLVNTSPNDVILKLADSLKGASSTQIDQTLKMLGIGSQEASQVVKLLTENTDKLTQRQTQAAFALSKKNDLDNEASLMQNTLGAKIDMVKKAMTGYATSIGNVLAPYLPFIQGTGMVAFSLAQLLPLFPFIITGLTTMTGWIISASTATMGFVTSLISSVVTGFVPFVSSLALSSLGLLRYIGQMGIAAAITAGGFLTSIGLATAGQWLFNAALSANPIGVAIALLAGLAAGLIYAYQNFEGFRNIVDTAGKAIGDMFGWVYKQAMNLVEGVKSVLQYLGLLSKEADKTLDKASKVDNKRVFIDKSKGTGIYAKQLEEAKKTANQERLNKLINPNGNTGGADISSATRQGSPTTQSALDSVSGGGSKPTNINISIGKLNEKIEISTVNLKEGIDDIEAIITQMFMRVLNGANQR
jgi:TP901 family phage tail tape measure protein